MQSGSLRPEASKTSSEDAVFRWFVALVTLLSLGYLAAPSGAQDVRTITLPVPVETVYGGWGDGGVYWTDTYGAPRSGGRTHQGVDMMGPRMIPLLAARDGEITWMRHDAARGNNLVITDDEGWSYHYIHINNDTPGTDDGANPLEAAFSARIAEAWENGTWRGMRVSAGELVAYMGDSGNAEACNCPHLHFEIVRPDGININPTASVDAALAYAQANPQGIEVDPELLGPYSDFAALADDVYQTLEGRQPTVTELLDLRASLEANGFAGALVPFVDNDSKSGDLDRLYVAYFDRLPDYEGYAFWQGRLNEWSLRQASRHFAGSEEYLQLFGDATLEEFLEILYDQVLGRQPDASGEAYWADRLENDPEIDRANIVAFFTDSPELRGKTEHRSEIVALTALFAERMPTAAEIEAWETLRSTSTLTEAISQQYDAS